MEGSTRPEKRPRSKKTSEPAIASSNRTLPTRKKVKMSNFGVVKKGISGNLSSP